MTGFRKYGLAAAKAIAAKPPVQKVKPKAKKKVRALDTDHDGK